MLDVPYEVAPPGRCLSARDAIAPLGENPVLMTVREAVRDCARWLEAECGATATPLPRFSNCWVIYPVAQAQAPILLQADDHLPVVVAPASVQTPARTQLVEQIKEFMTLHGFPIRVQSKLSGLRTS